MTEKAQTVRMYAYKEMAVGGEKVIDVAKQFKELSEADQADIEAWAEVEMKARDIPIKAAS